MEIKEAIIVYSIMVVGVLAHCSMDILNSIFEALRSISIFSLFIIGPILLTVGILKLEKMAIERDNKKRG